MSSFVLSVCWCRVGRLSDYLGLLLCCLMPCFFIADFRRVCFEAGHRCWRRGCVCIDLNLGALANLSYLVSCYCYYVAGFPLRVRCGEDQWFWCRDCRCLGRGGGLSSAAWGGAAGLLFVAGAISVCL